MNRRSLALGLWFLLLAGISIALGALERNAIALVVGLVLGWWGTNCLKVRASGLVVQQAGIAIHEPSWGLVMRRHELTWSELDHFELRRPTFLKGALRVHRRDGKVMGAVGLEARKEPERGVAEAWVDQLNHLAAAARG